MGRRIKGLSEAFLAGASLFTGGAAGQEKQIPEKAPIVEPAGRTDVQPMTRQEAYEQGKMSEKERRQYEKDGRDDAKWKKKQQAEKLKEDQKFAQEHGGLTREQYQQEKQRKLEEKEAIEGFALDLPSLPSERSSMVRFSGYKIPGKEKKAETATPEKYIIEDPNRRLKIEIQTPIKHGSEVLITQEKELKLRPGVVVRSIFVGSIEASYDGGAGGVKVIMRTQSPLFTEVVPK